MGVPIMRLIFGRWAEPGKRELSAAEAALRALRALRALGCLPPGRGK